MATKKKTPASADATASEPEIKQGDKTYQEMNEAERAEFAATPDFRFAPDAQ